ncbi:MAG: PA2778 family cysteine peptidase [Nitrospirota bacterium]|nr:PA2778 family cysteine peptidase [Nitrospirota bacterium]
MRFPVGAIHELPLRLLPLILLFLSGCATLETTRLVSDHPADLPSRVELSEVLFHPQEDYQCGPASLAMLLNWSGDAVTPDDLVSQVYSPARKGSLQPDMITATRRHGRIAYPLSGMENLLAEIAAGNPAIVLQNLGLSWYPVWHYAVVIGYDLEEKTVILRSGKTRREVLSMKLFERTWARSGKWGMLVLPPDRLPGRVDEKLYLESVVGLERASQWSAAITGYETALARWPESLGAMMGLGNSRYALGNLAGAEEAFRKAVRRHPGEGASFNNLAQVLSDRGKKEEALVAARRAVELGGPLAETYRQTLEEIEKK